MSESKQATFDIISDADFNKKLRSVESKAQSIGDALHHLMYSALLQVKNSNLTQLQELTEAKVTPTISRKLREYAKAFTQYTDTDGNPVNNLQFKSEKDESGKVIRWKVTFVKDKSTEETRKLIDMEAIQKTPPLAWQSESDKIADAMMEKETGKFIQDMENFLRVNRDRINYARNNGEGQGLDEVLQVLNTAINGLSTEKVGELKASKAKIHYLKTKSALEDALKVGSDDVLPDDAKADGNADKVAGQPVH